MKLQSITAFFKVAIPATVMLVASNSQAAVYSSQAGTDWSLASTWTPLGIPGGSDTANVGHAVTVTDSRSVEVFNMNGSTLSMGPSGGLTIISGGTWTGGTINIGGLGIVFPGVYNITPASNCILRGAWTNSGVVSYDGDGASSFWLGKSIPTTFNNSVAGVFDFKSDVDLLAYPEAGTSVFNNFGTVRKSGGNGMSSIAAGVGFVNKAGGIIEASSGTLQINNGTYQGGDFRAAGGAAIEFQTPSTVFAGSFTGSGTGAVKLATTFTVGAPDATFDLPGDLLQFTNGAIVATAAPFRNSGTMTLSSIYTKSIAGSLVNPGVINHRDAGNFEFGTSSSDTVFTNEASGTYDFKSDAGITYSGSRNATINNHGRFAKSGGTGTSAVAHKVKLNNFGTVAVTSGTLLVDGTPQFVNGDLSGGTWYVGPGAILKISQVTGTNPYYIEIYKNMATVTLDGLGSAFGQIDYISNNTGTLNVIGGRSFSTRSGSLKNYGAIHLLGGGLFTVNGDFTVYESGYLTADAASRFMVLSNAVFNSTQGTLWHTENATLTLDSRFAHSIYLPGQDLGAVAGGFADNFAWGALDLPTAKNTTLRDGNPLVAGAALYVREISGVQTYIEPDFIPDPDYEGEEDPPMIPNPDAGQRRATNISGFGFNIYYLPELAANAYLDGKTYDLIYGGRLMPVGATSGFDTWAATNHANGQTVADDHDHDGMANGIEYFLVGPNGVSTGFTTPPGVTRSGNTLSVTWTRGAGYTGTYGTDFMVQTSESLVGAWTTEVLDSTVILSGNDLTYTFPQPGPARRFVRLKINGP
ncbi:MAG: calreticulin family protein [Akkermansiaceae bacterium]|jgi:hypothetical protein|nr:calreticulin family protein [Akkermansiaceae bacterium]